MILPLQHLQDIREDVETILQQQSDQRAPQETVALAWRRMERLLQNGASDYNQDDTHDEDYERSCWICFATDEESPGMEWVSPCICKNTMKWAHVDCLKRWVEEKQQGDVTLPVICPQCRTQFLIYFPTAGALVRLLDCVEATSLKVSPMIASGMFIGGLYWMAATYGAITVFQVFGHDEGLELMSQFNSVSVMVALPSIPIALIVGSMIRWEDFVLNFIRKHLVNVPIVRNVLPFEIDVSQYHASHDYEAVSAVMAQTHNGVYHTRVLSEALLLPSIAVVVGQMLFRSVHTNVNRALLGGLTFVAIKGCLSIYHRQHNYIRLCKRTILNYTLENQQLVGRMPRLASNREPSDNWTVGL